MKPTAIHFQGCDSHRPWHSTVH